MTDDVRVLVKKYIYLGLWFTVRESDHSITSEQFETVLNEIGRLETELIISGVSDTAIDKIISFVKNQYPPDRPISTMTENQQLGLFKMIFGRERVG